MCTQRLQHMNMLSTHCLLTEEQLLCCICLEVFTDPVTLPCGHNFCKDCITCHLNSNSHRRCPMCKEPVNRAYKLGVNTFISEVAVQFRHSTGRNVSSSSSSSELHDSTPAKVPPHVPTGPHRTKRNFCLLLAVGLMCLTLYFAIWQNLQGCLSGLRTHLSDRVDEVADSSCSSDLWPMIQEREQKIQELKVSVRQSREAAARAKEHGALVFTSLIHFMEAVQAELLHVIEQEQKTKAKQAKAFIEHLELEISELRRRRTKEAQLSRSEHLLHNVPAPDAGPPNKDRAELSVCPVSFDGHMRAALVRAVNRLTETVGTEMMGQQEAELDRAQQNAVDVTLDPDTAHPALVLSRDGKRVSCGDMYRKLPDTSQRFIRAVHVLAKQSFSCGTFHYDVGVKGKTAWTIGVAQSSVDRKGTSQLNPDNGYWTLRLRNRTMYFALDLHPVTITVDHRPEKVKVYVDYEQGLVSFYDVDAAALLYSFTGCSFTERLHPFFSPGPSDGGRNAAPLIISPVHHNTLS